MWSLESPASACWCSWSTVDARVAGPAIGTEADRVGLSCADGECLVAWSSVGAVAAATWRRAGRVSAPVALPERARATHLGARREGGRWSVATAHVGPSAQVPTVWTARDLVCAPERTAPLPWSR